MKFNRANFARLEIRIEAILTLPRIFACLLLVAFANAAIAERTFVFRLVDALIDGRKLANAAVLIPLRHNAEEPMFLQLDTGADKSIVYRPSVLKLERLGLARPASLAGEWLVDVQDSSGQVWSIRAQELDRGDSGDSIVGSIGVSALLQSSVLVDFVRRRLRIAQALAQEDLTSCFDKHRDWVPFVQLNDRFGITVTIDGAEFGPILLDTGTSAFGLVLFEGAVFRETGANGDLFRGRRVTEEIRVSSANTLSGPLVIRKLGPSAEVCALKQCDASAAIWLVDRVVVQGFKGTFGNQPFLSGALLLDFFGKRAAYLPKRETIAFCSDHRIGQ